VVKKENLASVDGALFHYTENGIREPINRNIVQRIITDTMSKLLIEYIEAIKVHDKNAILDFLISHAEDKDMAVGLKKVNRHEINLDDGILDVRTWDIRPYSKSDYKLHKLDYHSSLLDTTANPEKWLNFLNQILE